MAKLGRSYSLATSYDIAFLHLVLAALEEAPSHPAPCTALPFRQVSVRQLSPRSERWLAAVNVLLIEAKCRDDVADEGSWRGRLGLRVLGEKTAWAEEVMAETGFPPQAIRGLPERQAQVEQRCQTLEELALPTSVMLGEVFAHLSVLVERPQTIQALRHLGQGLGMAIYLKDGREDRGKDARRGRFNAVTACRVTDTFAAVALGRELERARHGLELLGLGPEAKVLDSLLRGLLPELPQRPSARALSAPRRLQRTAGVAEILCCCIQPIIEGLCSGLCTAMCDPCACCWCASEEAKKNQSQRLPPAPLPPNVSRLLCPACGEKMELYTWDGIEMDECRRCHGIWLDQGELEALAAQPKPPQRLLRTYRLEKVPFRPEGTRPCPRCAQYLTVMTIKGTRVDMCRQCQGLFLDQGELNALLT